MKIRHSTVFLTAAGLALGVFAATNAGNASRSGAVSPAGQSAPAVPGGPACAQSCPKAQAACPKAQAACPKAGSAGCPDGGQACPKPKECPNAGAKAGPGSGVQANPKPAPKAPAAPAGQKSADAGFRPSAYPNVNVRFQPGGQASPAARDASIYVQPGVDPSTVRRGGPSAVSAPTMASAQRIQEMPDGSTQIILAGSHMDYVVARVQPSGRIGVGCGAGDGHDHAGEAKGATR